MVVNTKNFTDVLTDEDVQTLKDILGPAVLLYTNKTLDDITNYIGANHLHYPVRNDSGATILAGAVVTAAVTQPGTDYLAINQVTDPQTQVAVGITHMDLPNNGTGLAINTGIMKDHVDTSAWAEGTILYPNNAGGLTSVKPTSGQYQACAIVTRSHATNGTLLVEFTEPKKIASTTQAGYVQLVDDMVTADSTKAATANVIKQLKDLVDRLDASIVLMGLWDASAGTFPTSTNGGESWIVSVGGTVDGVEFKANDRIVALVDGASSTVYASNWHKLDYTDAVLSVDGQTGAVSLIGTYARLAAANTFSAVQGSVQTAGANAIDFTGTNSIRFTATAANITVGTMATKKGQEFTVTIDSAETATGWGTEFSFAPDFSAVTPTPPEMVGTMKFHMEVMEVNGVDGGTANKIHVAWAS